jgi:hypothetical protein
VSDERLVLAEPTADDDGEAIVVVRVARVFGKRT